ncbi:hypothetical protein BCF53_1361 [Reinekea marinisedimentorum]|uniref:Uncharacterized protein n=2 Tax=Reinekea marinisedimentorum TaxID=230495 RepID=A0A4R3HRH7_9GAMM|nr:hypothetical protein BCF53_1361 [Reinekea marinisedimentorum]
MIFITNSSMIYIEQFGLSEALFSALFVVNTGIGIIANRVSSTLLNRHAPHKILSVFVGIQILYWCNSIHCQCAHRCPFNTAALKRLMGSWRINVSAKCLFTFHSCSAEATARSTPKAGIILSLGSKVKEKFRCIEKNQPLLLAHVRPPIIKTAGSSKI